MRCGCLENDDVESDDLENGDLENDDLESDDLEKNDLENDDLENNDVESDDLENGDLENDDLESDDLENNDVENDDLESDDLENNDLENNDVENDDLKKIRRGGAKCPIPEQIHSKSQSNLIKSAKHPRKSLIAASYPGMVISNAKVNRSNMHVQHTFLHIVVRKFPKCEPFNQKF